MQNTLKTVNIKNFEKFLFYFAAVCIITLGLFLRIRLYLRNDPFWSDECLLALNVVNTNLYEIFLPLKYGQICPPLYVFMSCLIYKIFGCNTLALRFPSFLAGCLSLILFLPFLKKFIDSKLVKLSGLLLFSVSPPSIYYSAEFKPYELDLFFTVILIIMYDKLQIKNKKNIIFYSLLSAIICMFSYTAGMILVLICIHKFFFSDNKKSVYIIPVITMFPVYIYQYIISSGLKNFMLCFWPSGFLKLSYSSFFKIFTDIYSYNLFRDINSGEYKIIMFMLFVCGIITALIKRKNIDILIISVIFSAGTLSLLKIYPLYDRMTLWLFPCLLIFLIYFFDINFKKKSLKILNAVFLITFVIINILKMVEISNNPDFSLLEDMNIKIIRHKICSIILKNYMPNEKIIVSINTYSPLALTNKTEGYNYQNPQEGEYVLATLEELAGLGYKQNNLKNDMRIITPMFYNIKKRETTKEFEDYLLNSNEGYWYTDETENKKFFEYIDVITKRKNLKYEKYIIKRNTYKMLLYHIYDEETAKNKPEYTEHEINL